MSVSDLLRSPVLRDLLPVTVQWKGVYFAWRTVLPVSQTKPLIHPEELAEVETTVACVRQAESLTGRLLAKKLAVSSGITPGEAVRVHRPQGCPPRLLDPMGNPCGFVSLSYAREGVLAGVSKAPVGVDLEDLRDWDQAPARFILTDSEQQLLSDTAGISHPVATAFCVKEAALKLLGQPLRLPQQQAQIAQVEATHQFAWTLTLHVEGRIAWVHLLRWTSRLLAIAIEANASTLG